LEHLFTHKPSAFFDLISKEAETVFATEKTPIPDGAGGRLAATTFPAAARALFSVAQASVPALDPSEGDKWTRWLPRPRTVGIPGGALGCPFTTDEIYWILYGPTATHPPSTCEYASTMETPCPRCLEEREQFDAFLAGKASPPGKGLTTSTACGPGSMFAESFSWTRHRGFDNHSPDSDDGETVAFRERTCQVLATMFNCFLTSGSVPTGFSEAHVTLILKKSKDKAIDPTIFDSYRPISVISTLNKILSLALVRRFSHYAISAGLLGPAQAGFSHRLATEHSIFASFETIRRRIAGNEHAWALFIDLRRAYDLVNHDALLRILDEAGIAPNMVDLIRAMLNDASFRMDINGTLSESVKLRVGLPQGNPLSCLLFLFFIESLANYLDGAEADKARAAGLAPPAERGIRTAGQLLRDLLYADDLECLGSCHSDLVRARALVEEWCSAWRMFTNASPGKSEFMVIFRLENGVAPPAKPPPIPCEGRDDINGVPAYRLLGAHLDQNLDLKEHFNRSFASSQKKFNYLLHHKSHTINAMGPGRMMQILSVYSSSTYGLSVLTPTAAANSSWTKFCASATARITRWPLANTSRLLLASVSGLPSATARTLKERLRFSLQMWAHCHRMLPAGMPRHASIDLFDALWAEHSSLGGWNRLPNYFNDLEALICSAANPERPPLRSFRVRWARLATPHILPYIAGVTYFEAKRRDQGDILPTARWDPTLATFLAASRRRSISPSGSAPPRTYSAPGIDRSLSASLALACHAP